MGQNGAVRRGARVSVDPSGAPDPDEEQWERVEPLAPAAPLSADEGGGGAATATAPPVPTTIVAKGLHGEDLNLVQDEDGTWRIVNSSAPPPPVSAPVEHPLLEGLRSRTRKVKERVQRAVAYNHRMLWFMKPDGEVVKLQGDPGNRAYYEDKGFVVLTPDEVKAWERDQTRTRYDPESGERQREVLRPSIRKQVLKLQRERAALITMIRNIAARHAAVEVAGDLSITPTEELQAMVQKLQRIDGPNFTLLQARDPMLERDWGDDEGDNLDNLEVGRGDDLERRVDAYRKMARGAEDQRISGRQRLNAPDPVDLSGNE